MFDFGECLKDSKFYDVENEKVIAKMKDKTKSIPMVDFVGLNPKMYSFKKYSGVCDGKDKGINKYVVRKITHKEYGNILFGKKFVRHDMKKIQNKKQKLGKCKIKKAFCHALMIIDIYLQTFHIMKWS